MSEELQQQKVSILDKFEVCVKKTPFFIPQIKAFPLKECGFDEPSKLEEHLKKTVNELAIVNSLISREKFSFPHEYISFFSKMGPGILGDVMFFAIDLEKSVMSKQSNVVVVSPMCQMVTQNNYVHQRYVQQEENPKFKRIHSFDMKKLVFFGRSSSDDNVWYAWSLSPQNSEQIYAVYVKRFMNQNSSKKQEPKETEESKEAKTLDMASILGENEDEEDEEEDEDEDEEEEETPKKQPEDEKDSESDGDEFMHEPPPKKIASNFNDFIKEFGIGRKKVDFFSSSDDENDDEDANSFGEEESLDAVTWRPLGVNAWVE